MYYNTREVVILDDADVKYKTASKYLAIHISKDTFNALSESHNLRNQLQDMGIETLLKKINEDYFLIIVAADLKTAKKEI